MFRTAEAHFKDLLASIVDHIIFLIHLTDLLPFATAFRTIAHVFKIAPQPSHTAAPTHVQDVARPATMKASHTQPTQAITQFIQQSFIFHC